MCARVILIPIFLLSTQLSLYPTSPSHGSPHPICDKRVGRAERLQASKAKGRNCVIDCLKEAREDTGVGQERANQSHMRNQGATWQTRVRTKAGTGGHSLEARGAQWS